MLDPRKCKVSGRAFEARIDRIQEDDCDVHAV